MSFLRQSAHILAGHKIGDEPVKIFLAGRVCIVKLIAEALTELCIDGVRIVLLSPFPTVHHHGGQSLAFISRYSAQYLAYEGLKVFLHVGLRQLVNLQSLGLIATRAASDVSALLRLAYFYAVGCPVAHSLVRLHPRTTRLTPARTVEYTHLYVQLAGSL